MKFFRKNSYYFNFNQISSSLFLLQNIEKIFTLKKKKNIRFYFTIKIYFKFTSKTPSSGKSVQCTAFLTLSTPNFALIVFGLIVLAISGSCGPQTFLRELTTFSCLNR